MRAHFYAVTVLGLALSGCVAGPPPEIATAAPVLPQSYFYAPTGAEAAAMASLLPTGDPAFSALLQQAQLSNPTVLEQAARLDRAQAQLRGADARRLPQLDADASIRGARTNPAQFGGDLPGPISFDTEQIAYGANLSARWDPDLFGRLGAAQRAAAALVVAADADVAAIRLSLTAEIAGAVIDWRTLMARQDALREDVVASETLISLADIRERAGIAPGFDRVRAETAAEASRSRLAALQSDEPRIIGRLITLTALPAATIREALDAPSGVGSQPAPPPAQALAMPPALPSQLLSNRPDILAASARLSAADASLAATAARRFPQLTLSAAIGLLAFDLGGLFDGDAVVGSIGGSLLAPLLDFGRIEAEIDGAAADKRIAFQSYRGRVFAALGEAESAYGLVDAADRELAVTQRERSSANRAAQLAEVRFRAGLANFLTVLDARRVADASGERAAAAQGRAERARVLLWQALGGDTADTAQAAPES